MHLNVEFVSKNSSYDKKIRVYDDTMTMRDMIDRQSPVSRLNNFTKVSVSGSAKMSDVVVPGGHRVIVFT